MQRPYDPNAENIYCKKVRGEYLYFVYYEDNKIENLLAIEKKVEISCA